MSDNLTPKRPEDVTPDAQKDRKPQPVHPLMRRPPPSGSPDGQPPRRMARVVFNFARPARSYVTWALIAVNLAIFALTALIPSLENEVVRGFANQPAAVDAGEYWRLFTAMFLHANIIHVLMNMLALQSLGSVIEVAFGHRRYILIYILGGLAGSILSAGLNGPFVFSVGASGAVFALFGAEAAHLYTNWQVMGPSAQMRLRQVIMLAVLNFSIGFFGNMTGGGAFNIDNWAHIGGFLGGALLAYLIGPRYAVKVSPDQTIVQINDTRPLTGQFPVVIYFAAGLVAALIVTVLT